MHRCPFDPHDIPLERYFNDLQLSSRKFSQIPNIFWNTGHKMKYGPYLTMWHQNVKFQNVQKFLISVYDLKYGPYTKIRSVFNNITSKCQISECSVPVYDLVYGPYTEIRSLFMGVNPHITTEQGNFNSHILYLIF